MEEVTVDPAVETRRWLHNLYQHADPQHWLTIFAINRTTGQRHTHWQPANQLDQLADHAQTLAATSCVWFGAATRHTRTNGRGTAADCAAIPGIWLDIDIQSPNHQRTDLPPTIDAALDLLDTIPHQPTWIVRTGGGIQPWWQFPEPADLADLDGFLDAWAHTWTAAAANHGWHLDNVFDAARIMRLPGTWNTKTQPWHYVDAIDLGPAINADDLDPYLTTPPPPATTPLPAATYIGPARPGDAFNLAYTCSDVLKAAGWHHTNTDRDGNEHWTRPGKDPRHGTSATVYKDDGHATIWTSSVPGLDARSAHDPFGLWARLAHNGDFAEATRRALDMGLGARHIDTPLHQLIAPEPAHHDPLTGIPGLQIIDWPTLWEADLWTEDWAIPNVLAKGRGHAIYATAKTGKSLFVLERCAHTVATTTDIAILYIDYEMTDADVYERLESMGYGPDGPDITRLRYGINPRLRTLNTPEGATQLEQAIDAMEALHPGCHIVAIIDTIGRAVTGTENESDTYLAFYLHTGMMLKRRGVTYARLDHAGKDPGKGQRGSSAKNDDVDVVYRLDRTADGYRLNATHRRMGWVPERSNWQQTKEPLTFTRTDQDTYGPGTKAAVDLLNEVGAPRDIGKKSAWTLYSEQCKARNISRQALRDAVSYRQTGLGRLIEQ